MNQQTIYVLTFHGLGHPGRELPDGEGSYWLEPEVFESILDGVKDRADVQITFDDSNTSDYTIAFPALRKRDLQGSFFVVVNRLGFPGCLTREQVQEMSQNGMIIGSHGTRHRPWAELGTADLEEEVNASREQLEKVVGQPVREAACPFGSYNRKVLKALRVAGYTKVYTSDQGSACSRDWLIARNTILREHTLDHVKRAVSARPRPLIQAFRSVKLTFKRLR